MTDVKVYIRQGAQVLIGPMHAWDVGDRVTIPSAQRPWPHGDYAEGFDGIVRRVEGDGVAVVTAVTEEDR